MRILDTDANWWKGYEEEIVDYVAELIDEIENDWKRYKEIRYLIHSLYHESSDSGRFNRWTLIQDYNIKKEDILNFIKETEEIERDFGGEE